jgi:hypothetical protein
MLPKSFHMGGLLIVLWETDNDEIALGPWFKVDLFSVGHREASENPINDLLVVGHQDDDAVDWPDDGFRTEKREIIHLTMSEEPDWLSRHREAIVDAGTTRIGVDIFHGFFRKRHEVIRHVGEVLAEGARLFRALSKEDEVLGEIDGGAQTKTDDEG